MRRSDRCAGCYTGCYIGDVLTSSASAFVRPIRLGAWLLAPCIGLLAVPAAARELHWRELAVTARLDAGGQLHVSELHRMVFTGDYNGGERRFRIQRDQRLTFAGIHRIEDDDRDIELSPGDLSGTDQFAWHDEHILRWRSRLPDALPFDRTQLTYRIDYALGRVLLDEGEGVYRLDHDFAFPDRPGVIERFHLHLEADPVWSSTRGFPLDVERRGLGPGSGVIVTLALEHTQGASSGVSASRRPGMGEPLSLRLGLAAALLCAVLLLSSSARARERALGRFDPVSDAPASAAWLGENLLGMRPELVGALYHERVGVAEVAALLARLEVEGKVRSLGAQRSDGLRLELLVERSTLSGYERQLIDKLFVAGNPTSAKALRKHYSSSGFYPPSVLSEPVGGAMRELLGLGTSAALLGWWVVPGSIFGVGLLIAAVVVVGSQPVAEPSWLLSAVLWGNLAFALPGVRFARRATAAVRDVHVAHGRFALWLIAGALGTGFLIVAARTLPLFGLVVLFSLGLCTSLVLLSLARTSLGRQGAAIRRRLLIAREQLTELLARGERSEAWVPYLVALDLRDGLEAMLRGVAAPDERAGASRNGSSSDSSGSPSSSPVSTHEAAPWVGGGGRFGGGGASFAWGDAVSELAQGVSGPAQSSSSSMGSGGSDGSGGGGGGSSGGGGGGGW